MENQGPRVGSLPCQGSIQGLSILYTNARSIVNKIQELKLLAHNSQPHIIAITESWTHPNIANSYLHIPNYYIAARHDRNDTQNGRGGGILIYVHDQLKSVETTSQSPFNQYASLQIPLTQKDSLSIYVFYRSPNSTSSNNQLMLDVLQAIKSPAIIVGDFNYPSANWNTLSGSADAQSLIDLSLDKFWNQFVDFPTHQSGNMLDLVFSEHGMINLIRDDGQLGNSDHSMIFIESNQLIVKKKESRKRLNYRRGDFAKLRNLLSEYDWRVEMQSDEIEVCWSRFKDIYHDVVAQSVPPLKNKTKKKTPWMTKELLDAVKQKQRAWNLHSTEKSTESWNRFKELQKNLKKRIRKAKMKFESSIAKNAKSNPKAFYAYIGNKRSNRTGVGPLQNASGDIIEDETAQAKMLNDYYGTVFETESLPVPTTEANTSTKISDLEITRAMVSNELKKLKRNSAPGPDGIENIVLIEACDEFVLPILLLFKKSLRNSAVPQDWRTANVTPVFKSGNKKLVSNYRPISLTSTISKIFESLIKSAIWAHLLANDLIGSSQHGFMQRKSCLTNLLCCMEEVTAILDDGGSADILYLDFSKAFDKVQHNRLTNKMKQLGISGNILDWVQAWLSGRTQKVVLNGHESDTIAVPCSVPQGSVLGPLLFIIYINDIDVCVEQLLALLLKFADDTKVIKRILDHLDNQRLQCVIDKLHEWADTWQLRFNIDKCKIIHMGKNNPKFQYIMNNTPIQSVESERDLGVIIDHTAKPSLQCAKAAQKANQVLGQLLRSFQCRQTEVLVQLYKVFVRPHLEYAVQAWCPYLAKDIEVMEKVQRRMVRQIRNLQGTYEEKLRKLDLTTLKERRERGDCIETFKMLNGFSHVDYHIWFRLIDRTVGPETRLSSDPCALELQPSRLDLRKNFFSVRVPPIWNALPLAVRQSRSVNQFKNQYDMFKKQNPSPHTVL